MTSAESYMSDKVNYFLSATVGTDNYTSDKLLFIDGSNSTFGWYDNVSTTIQPNSSRDLPVVDEPLKKDFVFDRIDVRVIFITLYTLVFCCCFFGKLIYKSFVFLNIYSVSFVTKNKHKRNICAYM